MNNSNSTPKAVIITALDLEHASICAQLMELRQERHPAGTLYQCGSFRPKSGRAWDVVVVEAGPGNTGTALEFERAVNHYRPIVALFVGVAGGVKDVVLGDVVAATKIYGYESGKERETFQPRPAIQLPSYALVQQAKAVARDGRWRERIVGPMADPAPQARVGPIAAGEKVVTSTESATYRLLRSTYSDAIAVEMEGYGFLHGAYANQAVAALVIRGISDLIEGKLDSDAAGWQERAAQHASAFSFELLAQLENFPAETAPVIAQHQPAVETLSGRGGWLSGTPWYHALKRAFSLLASPASAVIAGEEALSAQMDGVRVMIQDGHLLAAQASLERIEQQIASQSASPQLKIRLALNRGACALLLGDLSAAERECKAALMHDPNSQKALANLAQIALIQDRLAEALRYSSEAIAKGPKDVHATAVRLRVLHACGQTEELQQLLQSEPWIADDPACCLPLGLIAYDQGVIPWRFPILAPKSFLLRTCSRFSRPVLAQCWYAWNSSSALTDPPLSHRASMKCSR